MNLNELCKKVHANNRHWWTDLHTGQPITRNKGELLMLVITELSEGVDGIRKNLMDDHLPHRKMEEVEMADACIRIFDFCGGFMIQLDEVDIFIPKSDSKAEDVIAICVPIVSAWSNKNYKSNLAIAVALIRNYCRNHNLDLEGAIAEKMEYNKTRKDHTREARLGVNGKKI